MKNIITAILVLFILLPATKINCGPKDEIITDTGIAPKASCEFLTEKKQEKEAETTVTEEITTEKVTEKVTEKITEKMTEKEKVTAKAKEKITVNEEKVKEKVTEKVSVAVTKQGVPKYNAGKIEEEILELMNNNRKNKGYAGLVMNDELCGLASVRAKEASEKWSHERPNGTRFYTVFNDYGVKITKVGENLASGSSDPETLVNAWMNSEGHKENIMNEEYTKTGIAIYTTSNNEFYIAQIFEK